jgi:hypothetical protein
VRASSERSSAGVTVTEQLATGADGRERLVWSLYAVDGRPDPMRLPGQVRYGIRSMLHAPTASVIALAADCRPDCAHARDALGALAAQALPALLSTPVQGPAGPADDRGR